MSICGQVGISAGLHAVEDGGARDRQVVQIVLEVFVGVEAEGANDADDGGRTGLQAAGHVADIEENELARAFEDRADDLAAGLAQLLELKSHARGEMRVFGFSVDRHTHASLAKYRQQVQVRVSTFRGAPRRLCGRGEPVDSDNAGLGFTRYTIL